MFKFSIKPLWIGLAGAALALGVAVKLAFALAQFIQIEIGHLLAAQKRQFAFVHTAVHHGRLRIGQASGQQQTGHQGDFQVEFHCDVL